MGEMTDITIRYEYPPNIDAIRAAFELRKGVVFTYGNTIYNPSGTNIDAPLMVHEKVHVWQQRGDPEAWWRHYLDDPEWRVVQEAEAYAMQYKCFRKLVRDRERRHLFLTALARDLSSPLYGSAIGFADAYKRIRGKL